MFVRITSFMLDPSKAEEADGRTDKIRAVVKNMPGVVHAYSARNDQGEGVVIGIWESEKAATDAEETVNKAWSQFGDLLTAPPERKAYPTVHQLDA